MKIKQEDRKVPPSWESKHPEKTFEFGKNIRVSKIRRENICGQFEFNTCRKLSTFAALIRVGTTTSFPKFP